MCHSYLASYYSRISNTVHCNPNSILFLKPANICKSRDVSLKDLTNFKVVYFQLTFFDCLCKWLLTATLSSSHVKFSRFVMLRFVAVTGVHTMSMYTTIDIRVLHEKRE
jgi:hypothetical protein